MNMSTQVINEKMLDEVKVSIKDRNNKFLMKLIIAVSLVLIIFISGFIGAAVPLGLKRLNIDPALATGPFVTTSNDVISLLIYLGLVTVFMK